MIEDFRNKLKEERYSYSLNPYGYYVISPINRINLPMVVQLVQSKPIDQIIHGSQNGNEVDAIGYFRFRVDTEKKPDIVIFVFQQLEDNRPVFMIIPAETLRARLLKNKIRSLSNEYFELRLWLMDGKLFDTTNFGLEAEWYYLSDGKGGRMIEPNIWNYTSFLNNWTLDYL